MVYPHKWSPHQLQLECRTAKAHRPKTDVLPLVAYEAGGQKDQEPWRAGRVLGQGKRAEPPPH